MSEIAAQLRELSEPWERGDRTKAAIARAAQRAGLSYWRAFDIWYGKARRIEAHEAQRIAKAVDNKRIEGARNELHELRARLSRLESLLAQSDPNFHRESLAQTRSALRHVGGNDRAADRSVD